jgi:hypothetical protein
MFDAICLYEVWAICVPLIFLPAIQATDNGSRPRSYGRLGDGYRYNSRSIVIMNEVRRDIDCQNQSANDPVCACHQVRKH